MRRACMVVTVCLVCSLVSCGPKAPARPAGVDTSAFWVGDSQHGVFVYDGGPKDEGFLLKIHDDHTGTILSEGLFVLHGPARTQLPAEIFARWDGEALVLKDGTRLVRKQIPTGAPNVLHP